MGKSILKQLKENEREVRRQLIISAAKSLYKKHSFHEIGMRSIATEAGISVASLYQYFPSQDDLFVEILKKDLSFVKKYIWNDKTSLEEISIDIVDFLTKNEEIFQMMSHFMVKGEKNSDALSKFNKVQDLYLELLSTALAKADPSTDVSFYSHAFFTALFGNVITFRNHQNQNNTSDRENLYQIVKITARAFQEAIQSNHYMKNTA